MPQSVAILGGGIAGLTAAYELHKQQQAGADITFTLVEASKRLGGIVETVRSGDFILECGPEGWVTEKPWARELAEDLGLGDEIITSRDEQRVTYVVQQGKLQRMPENMRMMVPEQVDAVMHSPLFSDAARAAYAAEPQRAEELKATAPVEDESVASFVQRHFGEEVLRVIGAPLLGGVFGGDVERLSVRAVMPAFVQMEQEYGSLILALQAKSAARGDKPRSSVFTSLRSGIATLTDRLAASLPAEAVQMERRITSLQRTADGWLVASEDGRSERYDHVMLALPVTAAAALLHETDSRAAELIRMPGSSAVIVAFAFAEDIALPAGFGFLSPEGEDCQLLAATFADQKFENRAPAGRKVMRAYFGGSRADALIPQSDAVIAVTAKRELEKVLGTLPDASESIVRRWPDALPQYEVGHLERMAELQKRVDTIGALNLLGNGYRGVGLPDLIRDARAAARVFAANSKPGASPSQS